MEKDQAFTNRKRAYDYLPVKRGLFYGGSWHEPLVYKHAEVISPSNGDSLGYVAEASARDVDAAVAASVTAYQQWRRVPPADRAELLHLIANVVRQNARELALIDATDSGSPVHEMAGDVANAASQLDFFAGLVTEMKGSSVPKGPESVNFSVREPRGVVGRIIPFNHPFMFCAAKCAAPLAAGNTIIVKPPEQAPLSALRFAELVEDILPPGVLGVLTGGREVGSALASHRDVAMISLIGSVPAGRAVMKAASETLKPLLLELGGKNALIALPDSDPDEVANAVIAGMNFTWCGQSCGSTSRAFIHESIHDEVVKRVKARISEFRPGDPTDPATTMGAIVSRSQLNRITDYIKSAIDEGATLLCGGKQPEDVELAKGFFSGAHRFHRGDAVHATCDRGGLRSCSFHTSLVGRAGDVAGSE